MTCITFTIHSPSSASFDKSLTCRVTLKSVSMGINVHVPSCMDTVFAKGKSTRLGFGLEALELLPEIQQRARVGLDMPIDIHSFRMEMAT